MHKLLGLMIAAACVAPAADRALLNLAMPDARVMAGVNVTGLRDSPFGQFLNRMAERDNDAFRRFVANTGFDPWRDLREVIVASPGGREERRRLVLARGVFDPARIISFAASQGANVTNYAGVDIVAQGRGMAFAFLDDFTAVAGDIDSVRGVIDRRAAGSGIDPALVSKIDSLSAVQEAWFVSRLPMEELSRQAPSAAGEAMRGDVLKTIESASGGIRFAETVNVSAELAARTPQDATALADALRMLAGFAQLQRKPGFERFQEVWNSLDITALGNLVTIGLAIPEELIESSITIPRKRRR